MHGCSNSSMCEVNMKFRKDFSAFFLCFVVCIISFAQEVIPVPFQSSLVFPSEVNPMITWGIRDERGFHHGYALVKLDGKWGAIDKTGEIVIQPQFDQVEDFIEGLKLVKLDSKPEFTDKTGEIIIQPQFEWIKDTIDMLKLVELDAKSGGIVKDFVDVLTLVELGRESGVIDKTNKVVVQPQFEWIKDFIDVLALIELGRKLGFIDETGKIIIQPQVEDSTKELTLVGLDAKSGDIVRDFVDVLTLVELGRESGVIDKTNKVVVQPQFEWIKDFVDVLALVELGHKLGFVDEAGRIVIQPQFDSVRDFTEGLAPVELEGKWGFVDKAGRIVIQPQFDSVRDFTEGLAPVELEGKWGFIDKAGEFLTYEGIEEEPELIGDVNGDEVVDIFDLVMVAGKFGKKGNSRGDINGDEDVNIFDLVMVAGNFGKGKVVAAPTMIRELVLTIDQKRSIESLVDQLESKYNLSSPEETVLNLLRVVLAKQLPAKTQLLPNYPNPFNPETWIPFELHQNTNISLTIFNLIGNQVRRIDLGYTQLGKYASRDKAIYWDGKNDNGEKVASGTYFYTIHTNDYTQTKKMVILK